MKHPSVACFLWPCAAGRDWGLSAPAVEFSAGTSPLKAKEGRHSVGWGKRSVRAGRANCWRQALGGTASCQRHAQLCIAPRSASWLSGEYGQGAVPSSQFEVRAAGLAGSAVDFGFRGLGFWVVSYSRNSWGPI